MSDKNFKVKNGLEVGDHISLPDNKQVQFGNSNVGTLHHDGSNFRLRAGTGTFNVQANDFHITDASNTSARFVVDHDGATTLFHNAASKLATNSGGVTVTGTAILGGASFVDNATAYFGTGLDLRLYHDGGNSYIKNNTGWLNMPLGGNGLTMANSDFTKIIAKFLVNGANELYYNGGKKLETSSAGGALTGVWTGNTVTQATGHNNTAFASTEFVRQEITALIGGAPSTLDTLNEIAASIADDANYVGTVNTALAAKAPKAAPIFTGLATFNADADSGLTIGNAGTNAMAIYTASGDELYIGQTGAYKLRLKTTGDIVMDNGGNLGIGLASPGYKLHVKGSTQTNAILAVESSTWASGSTAELRLAYVAGHNRSIKGHYANGLEFFTNPSTAAMTITANDGNLSLGSHLYLADNKVAHFGDSNDLEILCDGTNGYIRNHVSGGSIYNRAHTNWVVQTNASSGGANDAIKALRNAAVELYYSNSKKFETTSTGVSALKYNAGGVSYGGIYNAKQGAADAYGIVLEASGNDRWLRMGHNGTAAQIDATYNSSGGYSPLQLLTGGGVALEINTSKQVTLPQKITVNATDSQFYNRLFIKNGTHGLYMGQWDTANHRIESDANRPLTIQAYHSGGITLGLSGNPKLLLNNSGATVTGTLAVNAGTTNVAATFTSTDGTAGIKLQDNGGNIELSTVSGNFQVQPAGGAARLVVKSTGNTIIGNGGATIAYGGSGGYMLGVQAYSGSQSYISVARPGKSLDSEGFVIGEDSAYSYWINREAKDIHIYTSNAFNSKFLAAGGFESAGEIQSPTFYSSVASGGGSYQRITHQGNETWTWAAQSGSGTDDYLDVGIAGGMRSMSWHEDGIVGIQDTTPDSGGNNVNLESSANFNRVLSVNGNVSAKNVDDWRVIDLTGNNPQGSGNLCTTYFPVVILGGNAGKFHDFEITKYYGGIGSNGAGNYAGAFLRWQFTGYTWGGNPIFNTIKSFSNTYRNTIGGIGMIGFYSPCVFLRGGYSYHMKMPRDCRPDIVTSTQSDYGSRGDAYAFSLGPISETAMQAHVSWLGTTEITAQGRTAHNMRGTS